MNPVVNNRGGIIGVGEPSIVGSIDAKGWPTRLSGNVTETEKFAQVATVVTSVSGFATLLATGGDINKASRAAGVEGMLSNPMEGTAPQQIIKSLDYVNSARDAAGEK